MWKGKRLRQFGGTCGYFALVNAINYLAPNDQTLGYNDVEKLLVVTIQKGYSNIGEIFHYDRFESIVAEFKSLNKQINFDHKFVNFDKELVNTLSENQAIIVNYCSFSQNRVGFFSNSHWITIVKANKARFIGTKNKILIIDSLKIKKKNLDEIYASALKLKDKKFDWEEFLQSKGFKKHYMSNKRFTRRLNRYISKIGFDFKKKMDDIQYQKDHAIIEPDHSKCLMLTF